MNNDMFYALLWIAFFTLIGVALGSWLGGAIFGVGTVVLNTFIQRAAHDRSRRRHR